MGCYRYKLNSPEEIARFRGDYHIPDDVNLRLDNNLDGYAFYNGEMPFYLVTIVEGGVRFPLHPLLRECLSRWRLCPCQMLPNSHKIIMGVVELNRLLGTDLGIHDIEHCYDLVKSPNEETYYLRAKKDKECLVNSLEDSNKYAGDDRVFVSGNWEFGALPEEQRVFRVPTEFGCPPSMSAESLTLHI